MENEMDPLISWVLAGKRVQGGYRVSKKLSSYVYRKNIENISLYLKAYKLFTNIKYLLFELYKKKHCDLSTH